MKSYLIPSISLAMLSLASVAKAQEIVPLSGVVGPVGVASGVRTQGPGTLTVGAQDINTGGVAGGAITTTAANTANIVFNGSSTVNGFVGTSGSTFLAIAAGANASTVNFNGQVFATTFSLSGTGTVNFKGGFVSNTGSTMDFAGDGFINVGAGQTVKAALTNTAGANTGTLTLNSGSIFDGAVGAASGLKMINVVGGSARITGQVKSNAYTLGSNTLNVGGALAIPVGGVINTTILSGSEYGKIIPTGAATIGNALKINVIVAGPIANGSSFNIVEAASGSTGSTVTVVSNTPRYAFTAPVATAGLVRIVTTQVPLADVVAPVVATPGALAPGVAPTLLLAIAPVIDALPITPATNALLTAITLLPTAGAVAQALAQLGPGTASLASAQVSYRMTQRFQDTLASHLETAEACSQGARDRRAQTLGSSALCQTGSHFWASGFGYDRGPFSSAKQDNSGGYEGYSARSSGVAIGYDAAVSDAAIVGGALRFVGSVVDGNVMAASGSNPSSRAESTGYQAILYAGYAPGPLYLNGSLSYSYDRYNVRRDVSFPGIDSQLAADYLGHQESAFVTTGYHAYVGDGATVLTPYASLQYTSLSVNPYTEYGDPGLNLSVRSQHYNFIESDLGLKVARNMRLASGEMLRPEVHVNWLHAMGAGAMSNTASFTSGGPTFTTVGLKPDPNTFDVGTGLTFAHMGKWSLEGAYDYLWRAHNYTAQQMTISFVLHI